MSVHFIRHATFVIEMGDVRMLVDPMLGRVGAAPPIPGTPNQRSNPTVDLPFGDDELSNLISSIEAVLVTHTHEDHWDERARDLIPKHIPILSQPEDEDVISSADFTEVLPVASEFEWGELHLSRTAGQHGTGEIGARMAPASGFVIQAEGEPTLYIAGDTIWCDEVEEALSAYNPDVVVVNAGAAQFLEGDPITMTAEDVVKVSQAAPRASVIAVHLEAINHCLMTRQGLSAKLEEQGVANKVRIPYDGENLEAVV